MATSRIAVGSLLGMVQQTANTVTNIVGTVDASVSMLNSYVARHSTMQREKNLVELHLHKTRLIEDTAKEITERREEIAKYVGDENSQRSKIYQNALSEITALFNPELETA